MRHRFLPFPCFRLVRSGTASGESRILSAETSLSAEINVHLSAGKFASKAYSVSPVIIRHSTDGSKSSPHLSCRWVCVSHHSERFSEE